MSATRLLVLGVVRGYGQAHGYLVRSVLTEWAADEWANIKWGSLYHALRQLATQGFLTETAGPNSPGRVDYQLTDLGETEFQRLLREGLRTPKHRPDELYAALAFLPAIPRAEAIAVLTERLTLTRKTGETARRQAMNRTNPPHVGELFGHWSRSAAADASWTRALLAKLHDGAYVLVDDSLNSVGHPGSWPKDSSAASHMTDAQWQ
jgi:DNA-binding PadR family transcriptional regulator